MSSFQADVLRHTRRLFATQSAVLVLGLSLLAFPAVSQDEPDITFSQGISESFRVLILRDTMVLEPLADDLGVSTIELSGDEIVLDGLAVSTDELEARLGGHASAIRRLADIDPDERRALFESSVVGTEDTGGEEETAASAPAEPRSRSRRTSRDRADNRVVVASSLVVEEGEVSRDAVVFGGSLEVRGRVIGNAVAMGGSAVVSGEIDGDLVAIGGSIEVEDGAEIRGDVVSVGGSVEKAEGAAVLGQVVQVPFDAGFRFGGDWDWDSDHKPWKGWHGDEPWRMASPFSHAMKIGWTVVCLGILALLACLVLLLAPRAVERVGGKAVGEPWKAGLVGLLTQILFFPLLVIICLILLISVIGIPLLILVPFAILAVVLAAFLGYTAVAHRLGDWLEKRFGWSLNNPYLVLLLGIGLLQVWSLIAGALDFGWGPLWFFAVMFGLFGCLIGYVAWTVGLGAAIMTRLGTLPSEGETGAMLPPGTPPLPPADEMTGESGAWDESLDSEPEIPEPPEASDNPLPVDEAGPRDDD
ncbi:MAG: polymer-forming cytoskeletal protein [Acidobacteriota bacterium]|nr:polymer-forming cytoskeletal protein [Acidobacteriota bacterium]